MSTPATGLLSLRDVLPCASGVGGEKPEMLNRPLEPALGHVVADRLATGITPDELLCLALCLTESRLTGAPTVRALFSGPDGTGQAEVDVARQLEDVTAWRTQSMDVLRAADRGLVERAGDWIVEPVPEAGDFDSGSGHLSGWHLVAGDELRLSAWYRAPLTREAVELLADCVLHALAVLAAPGESHRDLLDSAQRHRQLVEWNAPARQCPKPQTVHGRFDSVAADHADSEAVVDADITLSYGQLELLANGLAQRLIDAGVCPGDIVAVAIDRSASAVVALLGILKAGAAYLPVDMSHPAERIAFVLQDASVSVTVVDADNASMAIPASVQRVAVSTVVPDSAPERVSAGADEDALAYVMYTSGSTGTPKGVEVRHRSIIRLVCDVDYVLLDSKTRMLHAAPLGFDAATLEIWGPLLNGGCVVIHDETLPTGAGLACKIAEHGVTTAWLTAALFNAIVDDDPLHLAGLRHLITGGEALSVGHVRRMLAAAPDLRLSNGYGPTECTTFTCVWAIPSDLPADTMSIPIGRPIADTRVYVLNPRRQLLPVGVIGELYVGGGGVARGYLGRPELTAERFVADPFMPGERLYRTGDLVRYRADGVIEFVGRNDAQVKIRGYRIELGEIESTLATHSAVRAAAVLAREGQRGEKYLVAYVVPETRRVNASELRTHLSATLPEFMVPSRYMWLDALPLTANGKLDSSALPAPDRSRPELACAFEPPVDEREQRICATFAEMLDIDRVGRHDNFFELGGSSLLAIRLLGRLRDGFPEQPERMPATLLFRHPTPAALAVAIKGVDGEVSGNRWMAQRRRQASRDGNGSEPIAIIGMAGRFPGAADVEAFWRNLCDGRDSITRFGPEQLDPSIPAADPGALDYVPARGVIDDVELFDAAFFGIAPKEAELMDPQQRVFLELCWECMECGGYAPDTTRYPVGVFAGMYNATYFQRHLAHRHDLIDKVGAFQVMLDNEKDYIATRVAHKLNLTGPAISVHTACSTSLVAICQAVDSLRAGRCDMALAGGISVTCPPRSGYTYQEGAMLSPDGRTRTFDADAKGTVFSDGGAVVLLKRLADAVADGDAVHAVICGVSVNNDGSAKASFTAPSSEAQAAVIAMAHEDAGIDPRTISYVETHGTATPLGDPIEIEGLTKAFRLGTADIGFCRIGSLKSNVGHLVIAAGAAGVVKTALALEHRMIPASLHFKAPNPEIDFASSPFVVNAQTSRWRSEGRMRRAGVSSFGVGGTNAHVVMEQAPASPGSTPSDGPQLLVLSARTRAALETATVHLADHLQEHPDLNLADVAWTLAVGRKAFAHRVAFVAEDAEKAVTALRSTGTAAAVARSRPARGSDVVFLFPGQGATYAGMGRALHAAEPVFREAFDACMDAMPDECGFDAGSDPGASLRGRMFGDDPEALLPTAVMQPATFAIEYALARLWMSRGLMPTVMIGHSIGEFVAAALAGVFEPADAMRLVARRGALMQSQPGGAMLSILLPVDAVSGRLPAGLSLAAENAPGNCVVAGPTEQIVAFQRELEVDGAACMLLKTSHAFHSAMMQPVVAPFLAEVEATPRSAPHMRLVSTMTGDWLDADTAMSPDYWSRHLREPVQFSAALGRVLGASGRALLEVGPRNILTSLARRHPAVQELHIAAIASLGDRAAAERESLQLAAGRMWCLGVALDPAISDRRPVRHRVRLPTYPFERQRYWVEAPAAAANVAAHPASAGSVTSGVAHLVSLPAAPATETDLEAAPPAVDRKPGLVAQLRELFEEVTGFDLADVDSHANFIELGLDSLMLTQVALQLQKQFPVKVSFRQLMSEASSLDALATVLEAQLPAAATADPAGASKQVESDRPVHVAGPVAAAEAALHGGDLRQVIAQQMQLMARQLALLGGAGDPALLPDTGAGFAAIPSATKTQAPTGSLSDAVHGDDAEVAELMHVRYDVKKAFGAIARIDASGRLDLDKRQRKRLDAFIERYVARTRKSKAYTQAHRRHMADPRVVNGFRPVLKEITYQLVIERSKGAHLWDLDGNKYVDALNGFGMSLFGWQPDFVLDAVRRQLELGYEIGPQHPLAGEVARLACEVTGHDRAALCNTGSEAVLGALRIARTVTGRETVVVFNGAYHGIIDEMIVRGTKKLRAVPAAPGILRNTAEHVLVLDYGTPESLEIIRERASEIAAVLVEPVQSRRPDLQPVEFLRQLREITAATGSVLVFDEVVTGFRAHPAGAQGLFGIRADVATYGKVVGGGYPIGVIAGGRDFMDALDGGHWQFGDDSVPTVGVTYFAGTFVRHPLALAAAKAVLEHVKSQGPQLQERLSARTRQMADELNMFAAEVGAPLAIQQFASVWKTSFLEEHPLQDLLFAMMRSRGVHILDNFPCFMTTAHAESDFQCIVDAWKESVLELLDAGFLPRSVATSRTVMDARQPPLPGARIGRDPDGRPGWYVQDPAAHGKFMRVGG